MDQNPSITSVLSGSAPLRVQAEIPTETLVGIGVALFAGIFLAMAAGAALAASVK